MASIGFNKYTVRLDNGTTRDYHSNALRIEQAEAGLSASVVFASEEDEGVTAANVPALSLADSAREHVNDDPYEVDEKHIPENVDHLIQDLHLDEAEDWMGGEVAIHIGDINVPADVDDNGKSAPPQTYYDKLVERRNAIHARLGETVTISQGIAINRINME